MTYAQLFDLLCKMTPEQLNAEIQYQDTNTGEFLGIRGLGRMGDYSENEDDDNPVLEIIQ